MNYYYSPHTFEHIDSDAERDWYGKTTVPPPSYDKKEQGCFFDENEGEWYLKSPEPDIEYPKSCTRRQGMLALLDIEKLDELEDFLDGINDPVQKRIAQINFEADTWEIENPFLRDTWFNKLHGTEEQLINLFILANTK